MQCTIKHICTKHKKNHSKTTICKVFTILVQAKCSKMEDITNKTHKNTKSITNNHDICQNNKELQIKDNIHYKSWQNWKSQRILRISPREFHNIHVLLMIFIKFIVFLKIIVVFLNFNLWNFFWWNVTLSSASCSLWW